MRGVSRWGVVLWAALAVAVAVPALAKAAPRISLGPIRGDRKSAVASQLASALCGSYECVLRSRVSTAGKPDFKKARKLKVAGILTGAVTKKRGGQFLSLALLTGPRRAAQTWSFQLTRRGTLSPGSVDQLSQDLNAQLGGAAPPPTAPALPEPPARAAPAVPPAPARPPPAPEPPPIAPATPAAPAPDLTSAEAPVAERARGPRAPVERRQWLAAVEVGAHFTHRKLSYEGAGSTLLGYQADLIASPGLHLEVFPASALTDGIFAGIGLFGDYCFSLGLKTEGAGAGGATEKRDTSFTRLQGGLLWRIHPASSSQFALIPAVSYQQLKFTVDPPFTGLPNANLSGVKGALNLEIPLGGSFSVLLGGGYVKWLTAKDLVKGDLTFFPGGSAYAIEAEAGVAWGFYGPLSLRVLGEYSSTKYTLEAAPPGGFQATSAKDEYIGGRAMLRGQF
jgi:hypothetical protein